MHFCFQVVLAGAELGDSVDEVDSLLKKHENTEKLTASQDEKVANLCEFGDTLVANGHNEADMITARVKAVCERRNKLKEELGKRRNKLEESKKIAQFYQDVVEVRREFYFSLGGKLVWRRGGVVVSGLDFRCGGRWFEPSLCRPVVSLDWGGGDLAMD